MNGHTTAPPATAERARVNSGLSAGARTIAEGTMRRVLAPIVVLVGLSGSAGALAYVLSNLISVGAGRSYFTAVSLAWAFGGGVVLRSRSAPQQWRPPPTSRS